MLIKMWRCVRCDVKSHPPFPLLLTSTGGTSPSCHWSSATCWLSWRPSSPMVCFKVTTSASPRQMLQSSGGTPSETSEPNSILLFMPIALSQWFQIGILLPYRVLPRKWVQWSYCSKTLYKWYLFTLYPLFNGSPWHVKVGIHVLCFHTYLSSSLSKCTQLTHIMSECGRCKNNPDTWNYKKIWKAGYSQYYLTVH